MRVLMVHNAGRSAVPSGERIVFDSEAQSLRDAGVNVETWIVTNDEWERSVLRKAVSAATVFWSPAMYRHVRRLVAERKPDIVHVHNIFPQISGSIFSVCRVSRVAVVQTLHNYRWLCVEGGFFRDNQSCTACLDRGPWQGVRYRCARNSLIASGLLTLNNWAYVKHTRLFRMVDKFVAVSHFLKQTHVAAGFPDDCLTVKYNGIAIPSPDKPRPGRGPKTVTFVGRLCPAKGTSILRDLPRLLPDCQLDLIGAGTDEQSLRNHFCRTGVTSAKLWGRLSPSESTDRIQASHCVVVPSLCPESFGLVAAESMAHGVPVVVSNRGALPELVSASGGGVVVQPEEGAAGFAGAIRWTLENESQAREMGKKGRAFARQELDIKSSAERLMNVYENVLSQK